MKNKFLIPLIIISSLVFLNSCEDFIAVNLSKESVNILAPANNTVSTNYTQLFWWDEVKGAEKYNLEIVKPSFANVQQLIVDTNVATTQFSFTLQPGTYQWRLKALNSSSSTPYVTYSLTIDSTNNLSGQIPFLTSPADNYYSNIFIHSFSWNTMTNASNYVFQLYTQTGTPIGTPQSLTTATTSATFSAEGVYKWRVFAQNASSSSPYAEHTITIDTTRPVAPVVTFLPLNDTSTANPIPLAWTSPEYNPTFEVLIASDSTFSLIIKDTITANSSYNLYNIYSVSIGQYYYWKVKAIDAATNIGVYCTKHKVKRQ